MGIRMVRNFPGASNMQPRLRNIAHKGRPESVSSLILYNMLTDDLSEHVDEWVSNWWVKPMSQVHRILLSA